jgi:hypothetical protein
MSTRDRSELDIGHTNNTIMTAATASLSQFHRETAGVSRGNSIAELVGLAGMAN